MLLPLGWRLRRGSGLVEDGRSSPRHALTTWSLRPTRAQLQVRVWPSAGVEEPPMRPGAHIGVD